MTTAPFTVTRPSRMILSAWRREATPAWDRIFWSRSSAISPPLRRAGRLRVSAGLRLGLRAGASARGSAAVGRSLPALSAAPLSAGLSGARLRRPARHAADLLELLQRRQLAQILEAELDQEFLGGLVQDRLADDVLAAGFGDQLTVQQRLQHAGALHAADFHDLGRGDRLLVGDHRQGLQGGSESFNGGLRLLTKLRTASWCSGLVAIW